jgi:hypothetical protein
MFPYLTPPPKEHFRQVIVMKLLSLQLEPWYLRFRPNAVIAQSISIRLSAGLSVPRTILDRT